MKSCNRIVCLMFSMMIAVVMTLCGPMEVAAAENHPCPIICGSLDNDGNVIAAGSGIPVLSTDAQALFTKKGMYTSEDLIYFANIGEGAMMEYVGSMCGMDMFLLTTGENEENCFIADKPVIGEKTVLMGRKEDTELISREVTITSGSTQENSEGMYELVIDRTDFNDIVLPAALVNKDGRLLAIAVRDNGVKIYAFIEPDDSANEGSSMDGTDAVDTDEDSPETPTRAGREDPDGPITKEPSNKDRMLDIACVALVLITAVILIIKKKKSIPKSEPVEPFAAPDNHFPVTKPVTPEYPVTKPVAPEYPATKPVEKPRIDGWEDAVTEDNNTGLFAVGVAGVLQGREFPISERGIMIGRGENMDVRYPPNTKGVSRQHCKVFWKDGVLMLMDMGSTSGTLLRGKGQLPADVPVVVVEGDIFYLGSKENAMTIRLK